MDILGRLFQLARMTLGALLDVEDAPERLGVRRIRKLEASLALARFQAAVAIAAERRLQREVSLDWSGDLELKWQAAQRAMHQAMLDLHETILDLRLAQREQRITSIAGDQRQNELFPWRESERQ